MGIALDFEPPLGFVLAGHVFVPRKVVNATSEGPAVQRR